MKNKYANVTSVTSCGQRVKQLAKKRGFSNQDIADILHYANGKTISSFYSGKRQFYDWQIEKLSEVFKVRKEYLLCLDDWETDAQMIEGTNAANLNEYQHITDYLSTLGLILKPMIFFVGNKGEIYEEYFKLKDHLTDKSKMYISTIMDKLPTRPKCYRDCEHCEFECATVNLQVESDAENEAKWDEILSTYETEEMYDDNPYDIEDYDSEFIELKSNPYDYPLKTPSELTKKDHIEDYIDKYGILHGDDNYYYQGNWGEGRIEILYKILIDNIEIGIANISDISIFFEHIDALCKSSIQTLLLNGVLCNKIYEEKNTN